MGLYINNNLRDTIYKVEQSPTEPNQETFIKGYQAERLKEQKMMNELLNKSVHELQHTLNNQEKEYSSKLSTLENKLQELQYLQKKQEDIENQLIQKLDNLKEKHAELYSLTEKANQSDQEIKGELSCLVDNQAELDGKVQHFQEKAEQLNEKFDNHLEKENQLYDKLEKHENLQSKLVTRLENQEVLSRKIVRKVDHVRSILFERTNYLPKKIERLSSNISNVPSSDPLNNSQMRMNKEKVEK